MLENASYLLSSMSHYLYDRILYPAKLYGTMMYPRETIEQAIELPKYVYMAGSSFFFRNDLTFFPSMLSRMQLSNTFLVF